MFSEIKNTRFFMERSLDKRAPVRMENKALSHCVFDNCSIGTQDDAAKISRFKNIRLSDCEILNCMVGPAVFEDIEINNLKTGDIAVFNLPLLKRVRLEGKIGKLKISNTGFDLTQSLSGEILRFKNDFYADTDWALDISRAQFLDFYCLGVPVLSKSTTKTRFSPVAAAFWKAACWIPISPADIRLWALCCSFSSIRAKAKPCSPRRWQRRKNSAMPFWRDCWN